MWMERLERDPTLLDYFNTFLSSKVGRFTIQWQYINCPETVYSPPCSS